MGRKHTLEEVIKIVANKDCKLLSEEYLGNYSKLNILCPCGDIFEKPLINFVRYPRCKKCFAKKQGEERRFTYKEVFNYFIENQCVLLEDKYEHSQRPLKYKCKCGKESTIIFNSFLAGTRCKECGKKKMWEKRRPTLEKIANYFNENNCILLETEYKNSNTPMSYICECGNKSKIRLSNFKKGSRCKACSGKPVITLDFLIGYFSENNCELLATEYKKNTSPLKYRCQCGNIATTKWSEFSRGHRCQKCKIIKLSGPNAPNWNPNRTDKDRLDRRQYPEYNSWRKLVFERDNYTCQICKKHGGYLIAHHLNSYINFPNQRTLLENGITLCKCCHNNFHSKYTVKNNTRLQFEEYLLNFLGPENCSFH